jgi:hypothetical protein
MIIPLELFWDRLAEYNPDAVRLDNFDQALVGIVTVHGSPPVAAYDRDRCISILVRDGMDPDEAEEFFQFNTEGAYFGPGTPAFLDDKIDWKSNPC